MEQRKGKETMSITPMYDGCPHCGAQPILLKKEEAERALKKEIPYDRILLCPNGCRYTVQERWNK